MPVLYQGLNKCFSANLRVEALQHSEILWCAVIQWSNCLVFFAVSPRPTPALNLWVIGSSVLGLFLFFNWTLFLVTFIKFHHISPRTFALNSRPICSTTNRTLAFPFPIFLHLCKWRHSLPSCINQEPRSPPNFFSPASHVHFSSEP